MLHHTSSRPPSPDTVTGTGRSVSVAIRPSVLRLGLAARLAGAAVLVAVIWATIGWGLS